MTDSDNTRWVTFREYSSLDAAEIDRGALQANGIPCVLKNATISSVYPMTDTWASPAILVPAEFLDEAGKICPAE